jgi:uncharacterized protein (TIGR03437 family)
VEWTPPDTDLGDVVFYAAGNAANNNNANTGDLVYAATHRIGGACSLTGAPAVSPGGVGNAADLRPVFGPNALISIFGSGFAEAGSRRPVTANDLLGGRLPEKLECTAVEIDGRRAPLLYVDAGQINAQAPAATGDVQVPLRVILNPGQPNEIRGNAVNVASAAYSPAFFTLNGRSIAGLNASAGNQILADPGVVAGAVPARPGDIVVLYGTGFGVSDPVYQAGEFAVAPLRDPITVTVGGTRLAATDVLYAGLAPDVPGAYQFNLRVPAAVADGDVPLSIGIGSVSTQPDATIPVRR